jgi:hypothetical protein
MYFVERPARKLILSRKREPLPAGKEL